MVPQIVLLPTVILDHVDPLAIIVYFSGGMVMEVFCRSMKL